MYELAECSDEVPAASARAKSANEGTLAAIARSTFMPGNRQPVTRRMPPHVDKSLNIAVIEYDGKRGAVWDRRHHRPFDTALFRACCDPPADCHFVELDPRSFLLLGARAETSSKILPEGCRETPGHGRTSSSRTKVSISPSPSSHRRPLPIEPGQSIGGCRATAPLRYETRHQPRRRHVEAGVLGGGARGGDRNSRHRAI